MALASLERLLFTEITSLSLSLFPVNNITDSALPCEVEEAPLAQPGLTNLSPNIIESTLKQNDGTAEFSAVFQPFQNACVQGDWQTGTGTLISLPPNCQ